MMSYVWPIVLQLLAFAVVFAEVLIPSFGLLALIAIALGVWSWYYIVTELPQGAIIGFAIADMILIPIAIRYGFAYLGRSPVSHLGRLEVGSGLEERSVELSHFVGATGVTESFLRPSGKVRVDGELYEAQTAGDFVEKGAEVRIVSVRGSGFIVERA
jgi:membrane-bound ClpP family serine protease